jgi:hypothetical protein
VPSKPDPLSCELNLKIKKNVIGLSVKIFELSAVMESFSLIPRLGMLLSSDNVRKSRTVTFHHWPRGLLDGIEKHQLSLSIVSYFDHLLPHFTKIIFFVVLTMN